MNLFNNESCANLCLANFDRLLGIKEDRVDGAEFQEDYDMVVITFENQAEKANLSENFKFFAERLRRRVLEIRYGLAEEKNFACQYFQVYGEVGEHLYYQFRAVDFGFDDEIWKDYCESMSSTMT